VTRRFLTFLANLCWLLACFPGWLRFVVALRRPQAAQTAIRRRLLSDQRRTAWGRGRDLAASAPTTYDDYREAVGRIMAGDPAVLTTAPVTLLEPTSGSTSAAKLIPYSNALRVEFQNAIAPWVFSLYRRRPRLLFVRHYWSISPGGAPAHTAAKIPVGFASDAEYLGFFQRRLASRLWPVPPEVRAIRDPADFWFVTALLLAAEPDLGLISVWHPSFLRILVETIQDRRADLASAVRSGRLPESLALRPRVRTVIGERLRPDPRRADLIARFTPDLLPLLWPRLHLVSCWDQGRARVEADAIRRWFPQALVQGKGLLATEGVVSIPWGDRQVAAVRSHCLEFLVPDSGRILPLHRLEPDREYLVLLTTGGGLVRYQLGDLVRCTGFVGKTPTLEFLGRTGGGCDLVGEKLDPALAEAAIVAAEDGSPLRFAMLAPDPDGRGYTLFFEDDHRRDPGALALAVERRLRASFHYDHARKLGQLRPVASCPVADALGNYRASLLARGMKIGDIKAVALHPDPDWRRRFGARAPQPSPRAD
jgi:hypothetical protein